MSRLIPQQDMTAEEIMQCSFDGLALLALCETAARTLAEGGGNVLAVAGDIATALGLARSLFDTTHDALEVHEGLAGEARHERAA